MKEHGATRYTLTDERYSNEPQTYESYESMVKDIEEMCAANGWDFDEDDLRYRED